MPQPAKLKLTPEELQKKVDKYFKQCEKTMTVRELKSGDIKRRWDKLPTTYGLALYLGVDYETLLKYSQGSYPTEWLTSTKHPIGELYRDDPEELKRAYKSIIHSAKMRIAEIWSTGAASGDINERMAAVILANMGLKEAPQDATSGTLTVTWQGVTPEDAESYSR